MIISIIEDITSESLFFRPGNLLGLKNLYIKFEGLNVSGSIKHKTARFLIDDLESRYMLAPGKSRIVESSSGSLGIALSIICKSRGYKFTCVTDPNISKASLNAMRRYGAEVIQITKRDIVGGYLGTRIDTVNQILQEDLNAVWTNQYANHKNSETHYQTTAQEVLQEIKDPDFLFIGVGTSGTLMGCARYFNEHSPKTKIIAVDSVGSVTFGFASSKRFIPGLGTSKKPPIFSNNNIDDVMMVHERDAIQMCRHLLRVHGLFLGGSSGSVLHAIKSYQPRLNPEARVVCISPDFGDKYAETIYSDDWVKDHFVQNRKYGATK